MMPLSKPLSALGSLDAATCLALVAAVFVTYNACLITYRLVFSPIAKFPGPRLAAATYWYEMYHDIVLGGQYSKEIERMHKVYGPVVRVSPFELHVLDPSFITPLYSPSPHPSTPTKVPRRLKWRRQTDAMSFGDNALFSTVDHDTHRMRRKPLEPFFSVAQIRKVQDMIYRKVELLCTRLKEESADGRPVRLKIALSCFTTDIITEYCLGRSHDYLSYPGFFPEYSDFIQNTPKVLPIFRPWPWLVPLCNSIPKPLLKCFGPAVEALFIEREKTIEYLNGVKHRRAMREKNPDIADTEPPTVIGHILDSSLPPHFKTDIKVCADIETFTAAGSETTGSMLSIIAVYVLETPDVRAKLVKELEDAIPDPDSIPPLQVLEKLPYFTAVIRECLRLGYGVYGRIQRIAEEPMQYKQWTIPPGIPVGMTAGYVHVDPAIWGPEPRKFLPERWLGPPEETQRLWKNVISFSKGSRMCLGVNLAYAEMYIAAAAVFRRFPNMKLHNFCKDDLSEVTADYFIPQFRRALNDIEAYLE